MSLLPTILVVDDDRDVRYLLDAVLGASGCWNIVTADCGDTALEVARRERPALILLDRRMPNGDGLTTFLKLREDPLTHETPVVLVSSFVGSKVPEGFAAVVRKPVDAGTLLACVGAILGEAKAS
jgi:CheY-like chemotaxis protein